MQFSWRWSNAGNVNADPSLVKSTGTLSWVNTASCSFKKIHDFPTIHLEVAPPSKDTIEKPDGYNGVGAPQRSTFWRCDAYESIVYNIFQDGNDQSRIVVRFPNVCIDHDSKCETLRVVCLEGEYFVCFPLFFHSRC